MEYERIHKVQTGIISPSKLRMKLMGPHNSRRKDGSNSNSSRTSPSKLDDTEVVKNSLLDSNSGDFDDQAPSSEVASVNSLHEAVSDQGRGEHLCCPKETLSKENGNMGRAKVQQFSKIDSGNSSTIHPMRTTDQDENLDYDSNASSSSFEFHKERSVHNHFTRSFPRPMPSKWNDAEKWIMNRQNAQPNYSKKNSLNIPANRIPVTNTVRVAPEFANYDPKSSISKATDARREDFCQPAPQMAIEKFSFTSSGMQSIPGPAYGENAPIDQCTLNKDVNEVDQRELSCTRSSVEEPTGVPVIRYLCMRDMGTEMTPATSLEPSRTATPVDATTPLRSPTSSIPSTPRRGEPAPTPLDVVDKSQHATENAKRELTEQELKEKTRREIVALGVQLGKMNIAAWASKDDQEKNTSSDEPTGLEELERIEFEKRAAAWEEVEKSKHLARYKREEIKIQAWECHQKAKLEAEMRRIEAQVEHARARAQAKMAKKIHMARRKSEQKRALAESRRNRDAERTAVQAEYIRQTGRMPSSHYICCSWLS